MIKKYVLLSLSLTCFSFGQILPSENASSKVADLQNGSQTQNSQPARAGEAEYLGAADAALLYRLCRQYDLVPPEQLAPTGSLVGLIQRLSAVAAQRRADELLKTSTNNTFTNSTWDLNTGDANTQANAFGTQFTPIGQGTAQQRFPSSAPQTRMSNNLNEPTTPGSPQNNARAKIIKDLRGVAAEQRADDPSGFNTAEDANNTWNLNTNGDTKTNAFGTQFGPIGQATTQQKPASSVLQALMSNNLNEPTTPGSPQNNARAKIITDLRALAAEERANDPSGSNTNGSANNTWNLNTNGDTKTNAFGTQFGPIRQATTQQTPQHSSSSSQTPNGDMQEVPGQISQSLLAHLSPGQLEELINALSPEDMVQLKQQNVTGPVGQKIREAMEKRLIKQLYNKLSPEQLDQLRRQKITDQLEQTIKDEAAFMKAQQDKNSPTASNERYTRAPSAKNVYVPMALRRALANKTQNCFMNAGLQCCLSMTRLHEILQNTSGTSDIARAYIALSFQAMMGNQDMIAEAHSRFVENAWTWFDVPGTQQDVDEFLHKLFEALEDSFAEDTKSQIIDLLCICESITRRSLPKAANSIGELINEERTSASIFSISIGNGNEHLSSCLRNYFAPTYIPDHKLYGRIHPVQATRRVTRLPHYLCISLNRIVGPSYHGQPAPTIYNPIRFGLTLDFNEYLHSDSSDSGTQYSLFGIIFFSGVDGNGHYFSFVKNRETWYCCDDTTVTNVDPKFLKEVAQNGSADVDGKMVPVCFFYEKIVEPANDLSTTTQYGAPPITGDQASQRNIFAHQHPSQNDHESHNKNASNFSGEAPDNYEDVPSRRNVGSMPGAGGYDHLDKLSRTFTDQLRTKAASASGLEENHHHNTDPVPRRHKSTESAPVHPNHKSSTSQKFSEPADSSTAKHLYGDVPGRKNVGSMPDAGNYDHLNKVLPPAGSSQTDGASIQSPRTPIDRRSTREVSTSGLEANHHNADRGSRRPMSTGSAPALTHYKSSTPRTFSEPPGSSTSNTSGTLPESNARSSAVPDRPQRVEGNPYRSQNDEVSTFFAAICDGDYATFYKYVSSDRGLEFLLKKDNNGMTPLHVAADNNQLPICSYIASTKGLPRILFIPNNDGEMPLHIAVKRGRREVIELLVKAIKEYHKDRSLEVQLKAIHPTKTTDNMLPPIHLAAYYGRKGSLGILFQMLKEIGDAGTINTILEQAVGPQKYTPLHLASIAGAKDAVGFLLKRNANVYAEDSKKRTPLLVAVASNNSHIISKLLDAEKRETDFDMQKSNDNRTNAIALARKLEFKDCEKALSTNALQPSNRKPANQQRVTIEVNSDEISSSFKTGKSDSPDRRGRRYRSSMKHRSTSHSRQDEVSSPRHRSTSPSRQDGVSSPRRRSSSRSRQDEPRKSPKSAVSRRISRSGSSMPEDSMGESGTNNNAPSNDRNRIVGSTKFPFMKVKRNNNIHE